MRRASLIVVIVLALLAALAWVATREASLQWAMARLAHASQGKLEFEGVRGSLFGGIDIARIRYSSPEVEVTLEGSSLRFALLPLLAGNDLVIERLAVEAMSVRVTPGNAPATPPSDLTLPLAVRIVALEIGRMTVQSGVSIVPLSDVRAQFDSDGRQHALRLQNLTSPWFTATASAQLAGVTPFALSGSARLAPVKDTRLPEIHAKLAGTLLDLQAELGVQATWLSGKASAGVQPFAATALRNLIVEVDRLELRGIDAALPTAEFKGSLRAHADGEDAVAGEVMLANDVPGPLSADRLPLRLGRARFRTDFRQLHLSDLDLQLARGAPLTGEATLAADGLKARLAARGLDLSAFHASLTPAQLAGDLVLVIDRTTQDLKARLADRRYRYEVDLMREAELLHVRKALLRADRSSITAQGRMELTQALPFSGLVKLDQLDPAAFGAFPSARLNGVAEVEGWVRPDWQARLKVKLDQGAWRGQPVSGAASVTLSRERLWDSRGELRVGRNEAHFTGALGAPADRLDVEFKLDAVQQMAPAWQGSTRGRARLGGTWRYPSLEIEASGENLRGPRDIRIKAWQARAAVAPELDAPLRIQAEGKSLAVGEVPADALRVEAEGTARQHRIQVSVSGPRLALKTQLTGGVQDLERWQGSIDALEVSQPRPVQLEAVTQLSVSRARIEVGAARLATSGGRFELEHLTIAPGTLSSRGSFSALPLALFNAPAPESGIRTTLRISGDWRIDAGEALNGALRLRRESGDVFIGTPGGTELQLGEGFLNIAAEGNELRGEGRIEAGHGAFMRATFAVLAAKEGAAWVVPATAPITLDAEANLPSLEWLGPFVHPSLVVNGKARAVITGRGTFGNPALEGRIDGSDLAISEPGTGVRLTKGTLRAVAAGDRLTLEAFQIHGKEGVLTATGQAALRGERRLQLAFQARQLGVLDRPNWSVNADADGTLGIERGQAKLEARVKVNRAQVGLPERGAPTLPEDVVIKGRTKPPAAAQKSRVAMDISVDLGNAFRVLTIERPTILKQALPIYESKLDAKLGGTLRIRSDSGGVPLAVGTIRVVEGMYTFLGKRLEIKRGSFRFDGPLGNPAVDILAMNEQAEVKVGASVTGTVLNPRVTLVSDPDVPEQEKISWLLFGRGGQQAEASLSSRATSGSGVALFGLQLTDKIYVGYEQGAAGAANVMTLYSKLTDRLSVEARTGDQSGLRLFYTFELKR